MTEQEAINELVDYGGDMFKTTISFDAVTMARMSLEVVDKIANIVKIEQQPTSCEYTKLKSFEMIERIITEYQLEKSK